MSGDGENGEEADRDAGGHGLAIDPERDERDENGEQARYVDLNEIVAERALELKYHLQARVRAFFTWFFYSMSFRISAVNISVQEEEQNSQSNCGFERVLIALFRMQKSKKHTCFWWCEKSKSQVSSEKPNNLFTWVDSVLSFEAYLTEASFYWTLSYLSIDE